MRKRHTTRKARKTATAKALPLREAVTSGNVDLHSPALIYPNYETGELEVQLLTPMQARAYKARFALARMLHALSRTSS